MFLFLVLLESLLLSLPPLMLTAYLLHCCDENLRSSKLLHAVLGLWAIFVALLVSTPFIDGFIYITSENQYYRGPLYPLSLLPLIAIQLLNLAGTIQRRKQLVGFIQLFFSDHSPISSGCTPEKAFSILNPPFLPEYRRNNTIGIKRQN